MQHTSCTSTSTLQKMMLGVASANFSKTGEMTLLFESDPKLRGISQPTHSRLGHHARLTKDHTMLPLSEWTQQRQTVSIRYLVISPTETISFALASPPCLGLMGSNSQKSMTTVFSPSIYSAAQDRRGRETNRTSGL